MVCAGTLAVYLRCTVCKCPACSPVPARVRRSILQQRRQKLLSAWPLTKRYNSSYTAHTPPNMHCNFWKNGAVDIYKNNIFLKKSQRLVSAGSKRRSFTSVRTRSPAICIAQKENDLQLMPTHQLYHSAHSCHLDHFLLRSSLSSVQRAARRVSSAPPSR